MGKPCIKILILFYYINHLKFNYIQLNIQMNIICFVKYAMFVENLSYIEFETSTLKLEIDNNYH